MSLIHPSGEKAEAVGRPKIADDEVRLVRDMAMYGYVLQGWTHALVGQVFNMSQPAVTKRLARLSEATKASLRSGRLGKASQRGSLPPAG